MSKYIIKVAYIILFILYSPFVMAAQDEGNSVTQLDDSSLMKYSQGRFTVGKKYKIKGKYYQPKIDLNYNEVGTASWYGPGFHGKLTANGAIYNANEYTAAHKTLPLPCVVQITNLENQNSIKVVVHDRGPFVGNRIIDVSKKVAEELGFFEQGTAKVKVEYLHKDTQQLLSQFPEKEQIKAKNAIEAALLKEGKKFVKNVKAKQKTNVAIVASK